ncbi:MAG: precorrin-8X methylmutase [Firmicutes bacterium]|nr:precorrin-8X methylmutase [Bacillota bacterium]
MDPREIEATSMAIIEPYLKEFQFRSGEKEIYKRVIHTTGEPSIASQIKISPNFVSVTTAALRRKCTIITDAEMVKAGINKRNLTICGNDVVCAIHDPEVIKLAQKVGTTRAVAAVSYLAPEIEQSIFAVGNAPTALYEVLRLIVEGDLRPAAIIGVPVGFVGAAESKELLISLAPQLAEMGIAWIALQGTRGGSAIAATIINALLIQVTREEQNV